MYAYVRRYLHSLFLFIYKEKYEAIAFFFSPQLKQFVRRLEIIGLIQNPLLPLGFSKFLFIYLFFGSGDPARDPVLLLSLCLMLPMVFKIFKTWRERERGRLGKTRIHIFKIWHRCQWLQKKPRKVLPDCHRIADENVQA